ncbi:MAG: hypothetical protein AB7E84_08255 [Xanthobacteraceae bacterium]
MTEDIAAAVGDKQRRDEIETAELISRGAHVVQVRTGIGGGMHPTFLKALRSHGGLGATVRTAFGTISAHVNYTEDALDLCDVPVVFCSAYEGFAERLNAALSISLLRVCDGVPP